MGFLRKILIALPGALLLLVADLPAQAATPEYQVKAAILYKFAVFVEWPAKAFTSDTSPFVVCVLGKDPFGPWLQRELGEARVGKRPVEIRHLEEGDAAGPCHLVFIAASEKHRLQKLLAPLRNTAALIVSDADDSIGFCRLGGMISIVTEKDKVRFHLNSKAIAQAGLTIDSRLKRVALSADCGEAK